MAVYHRLRRLMITATTTLLVAYLAICALAFFSQRALLYPAPTVAREPKRAQLVRTGEGVPMLWSAPKDERAPVVVHFHGNGEQIADTEWLAQLMGERGIGFLAVEYPGYGLAKALNGPSESAIFEAAERAVQHLTGSMGIAKNRLVLSGQSLGSGVAVFLAERGWGKRVLLLSPYTTIADVGAKAFPFLPVKLLMLDRFDSHRRAASVNTPVLVIHGSDDEIIPIEFGRTLAAKFPRAEFLEVPATGHNDLWDRPMVQNAAFRFLSGKAD